MSRRKAPPAEPEPVRRSDYRTFKTQDRDWDGWEFVGSMKWVRADTLGEFFDPEHQPAIILSKEELQKREEERPRTGRGGKRTGLPWPREYTDRMNATMRIVYKWEENGFTKRWQPWGGQPQWIALTEAGLFERQLRKWHEIDWPDKESVRHDDLYYISHTHRVNQMRVRLLGGTANAPKHRWLSERAIESSLPPKEAGVMLPHVPDGVMLLREDGSWDITIKGEVVDTVKMKSGQTVAIEVELSRKHFERLDHRVLPSLLEEYDYVWYFAEKNAHQAIYKARGEHLKAEEDQRRIRLLRLEDYL